MTITRRTPTSNGVSTNMAATATNLTMPTGTTTGDLVFVVYSGKYNATMTDATVNQGFTLIHTGSGGNVTTGNDVGDSRIQVFAKVWTGSEGTVTITPGTVNSWNYQVFSYSSSLGGWALPIQSSANWVASASDTGTTDTIITAAPNPTTKPAAGDELLLLAAGPTDTGTALGTTSCTAAGLSGGTVTAGLYNENSLGADSFAVSGYWTGFTGTATSTIVPSFTITGATAADVYGVVTAVVIREANAFTQAPTDNLGLTDSRAFDLSQSPADDTGLTDNLAFAFPLNDTLGLTDSRAFDLSQSQSDNLGLTDSRVFDFSQSPSDNLGLTDADTETVTGGSPPITDSEADNLGLTDSVAPTLNGCPVWYSNSSAVPNYPGGASAIQIVLDKPTNTTTNDILVAVVHTEVNPAPTITKPTGWTLEQSSGTTGISTSVFWKRAGGSEAANYTFSWTGGCYTTGVIHRFIGAINTGNPFNSDNIASQASSTTISSVSYTANVSGLGVWLFESLADSGTVTVPTGYTNRFNAAYGNTTLGTRVDSGGSLTTGTGSVSPTTQGQIFAGVLTNVSSNAFTDTEADNLGLTDSRAFDLTQSPADNLGLTDSVAFLVNGSATYYGSSSTAPNYPGGATATSLVLDKPVGTQLNDILVANVMTFANPAKSLTLPGGWSLLTSSALSTPVSSSIVWKRATGSEPSTYTFSWTGGCYTTGIIHRFGGAVTSGTPFDSDNISNNTNTTIPSVAYAANHTGLGVWLTGCYNDSFTVTPPGGYTARGTASIASQCVATRVDSSTGSLTSGTGTISSSSAMQVFAGVLSDGGTAAAAWTDTEADNLGLTDSLAFILTQSPSDNLGLTDTATPVLARALTDTEADNLGLTDSVDVSQGFGVSVADNLDLTDSLLVAGPLVPVSWTYTYEKWIG